MPQPLGVLATSHTGLCCEWRPLVKPVFTGMSKNVLFRIRLVGGSIFVEFPLSLSLSKLTCVTAIPIQVFYGLKDA